MTKKNVNRWAAGAALAALSVGGAVGADPVGPQAEGGPALGLRAVNEPLPWFDSRRNYAVDDEATRALKPNATVAVTSLGRPPMSSPLSVRLSRFRYPAEDGHLDVLVRFDLDLGQIPEGTLRIAMADAAGGVVSRADVSPIPGAQVYFSYRWPPGLVGRQGELRVAWERAGGAAQAAARFEIAPAAPVARAGRVRLTVPNSTGATVPSAPMTVGVPFPRGALSSTDHLRLVDDRGREIPLQVKETARWSRFGPVKWALCDFTLDLEGRAREVFLEYGPDVRRAERAPLAVAQGGAFPAVQAGRMRLDASGLAAAPAGDGAFRSVLDAEALTGAFVEQAHGANYVDWGHLYMSSEGRRFAMAGPLAFAVEEAGSEKVVLRTQGWYLDPKSGARFCQYVVRYVVHRDSPLLRVFHTWIFTGDGNRDTIRNMGWRFPLKDMRPDGFLSGFEDDAAWRAGYYLRQHDADSYELFERSDPAAGRRTREGAIPARPIRKIGEGRRAAGVMAARGQGVRLYVGAQDFWQNFPSSLMIEDGALTFYQWPRYGRPRCHPVHAGDADNAWRLWFAHEGEVLDFRLPPELTEAPLYVNASGPEPHFAHGRSDSVNAQGIAKTAEMWVYVAPESASPDQAARVLQGLSRETIRAVVDPKWMAASGAFYEIAAADPETRPDLERIYAENVRAPLRQVERMGIYGKWIYGDVLRSPDLDTRAAPNLYRNFRKAHWGWPFSWTPFARTGDTDLLRFAQAATRMMSDTAFCHYVSEEVARYFAEELAPRQIWVSLQPFRRIGWHNRNSIPWAGYWGPTTRCYVDQADYLWDAWHISGYHRARDVALAWAEQTKIEEPDKIMRGPITAAQNRARWPANLQKQYVEMYEETFDPWFLAAAQGLADLHVWRYREEGWAGHFWHAGYLTWQRYSGCPEHKEFILHNIKQWSDWHEQGWATTPTTTIPAAVFGYYLTGEEYYLRRAAGVADLARWAICNAQEPWYYRGQYLRGDSGEHMLFASWMQTWFPLVLGAFERAGGVSVRPLPFAFDQVLTPASRIVVRKQVGQALPLRLRGAYVIIGPDGRPHKEGQDPDPVIEAGAPPGAYTISLPGSRRSARLPLSPPGTPEVLVPGGGVGVGQDFAQYWFFVPQGVDTFWVEFENSAFFRQALRQVIVWDADGREAWAHRRRAVDHDPQIKTIRADLAVPAGQAGRLWRITQPGQRSMPFRMDPAIPPLLSHDPERWFDPAGKLTLREK